MSRIAPLLEVLRADDICHFAVLGDRSTIVAKQFVEGVDVMYWQADGMHAWAYVVMMIASLPLWLLAVATVVALVRAQGGNERVHMPRANWPGPEQILAEMFARGSIDADEYARRLDVLHRQR